MYREITFIKICYYFLAKIVNSDIPLIAQFDFYYDYHPES